MTILRHRSREMADESQPKRNGWKKWIAIIGVVVLIPSGVGTFWHQIVGAVNVVNAPEDIKALRNEMNDRFDKMDHDADARYRALSKQIMNLQAAWRVSSSGQVPHIAYIPDQPLATNYVLEPDP